jgi:mRNA interferase RelE/StbE
MKYKILLSKTAEKSIYKFREPLLSRLLKAIKKLQDNPRPSGCKKLQGNDETLWRIRVGDYRIIYFIDDTVSIVDVREVGNRNDIYK